MHVLTLFGLSYFLNDLYRVEGVVECWWLNRLNAWKASTLFFLSSNTLNIMTFSINEIFISFNRFVVIFSINKCTKYAENFFFGRFGGEEVRVDPPPKISLKGICANFSIKYICNAVLGKSFGIRLFWKTFEKLCYEFL